MLTARRIQIFKCIVEEFIKTAEPVGSKMLMEKYELPYSSATIRNEMFELEEMGYLEKTHTSSGRVPSTIGYKFYCENLMENKIDAQMEVALKDVFAPNVHFEDAIKKSCEIVSQMTNLASGVLGPSASAQHLEHIKLFQINERSAVAIFITDAGHTENRTFTFQDDVSVEDIQKCTDILNDRLKGTLIEDVVEKIQYVKPILASSVKRHEILFQAFLQAFTKFASDNVYFSGAGNILYQPEFSDIENIRKLLKMFEDTSIWRNISNESQMAVKTSSNSELVWLDDVAVISSSFKINSEEGKLMVVGPPRMDYDRVVTLLEYVSDMIEQAYGQGGQKDE